MPASPADRIAKLRAEITRHDELYYKRAQPEITDFDYDVLKKELETLEKKHPELAGPSPTQKVGDDRSEGFATARHRAPMLSLDNTYNQEELLAFDKRLRGVLAEKELFAEERALTYVVEPKVDGLAICITYEKGKFRRAVTRGNGVEGDDISANIRTVRGLPMELRGRNHPAVMELRGEIFLGNEEFRRINAEREEAGLPLYANPRNLAAGTAKQLDPHEVTRRQLRVILYGLGYCEPLPCDSQFELHQQLRDWGLPAHPKDNLWRTKGVNEVWQAIQKLDALRHDFDYATDGAVVKLDDFAGQRAAEATAKAPRWAMAYKFAPEQAETKINGVIIQVGRTGILAPVADLEPVFLAGSTISRATLHNADEIARKDIREGDTVVIEKAGEVIPAVVRVVKEKRPTHSRIYHFPEKCPACGTKAVRQEGEVAWRCPNPTCPPQVARRLQFFCTRKAMDIEDVGEIVADSLTKTGRVKDPLDLFTLSVEELGKLNLGDEENPRVFGEKNATRVVAALERARSLPLSRWLYALGIANVGDVTSEDLTRNHQDFDSLKKSEILSKTLKLATLEDRSIALKDKRKTEEYKSIRQEILHLEDFLFPFRIVPKQTDSVALEIHKDYKLRAKARQQLAKIRNDLKNAIKENLASKIIELNEMLKEREPKLNEEIEALNKRLSKYQFLPNIGPETAKSTLNFLNSTVGGEMLLRLKELSIKPQSNNLRASQSGALLGKIFVLTGALPSLKRHEATKLIEEAGGRVSGSVSKKTDYLVAGSDPSSKLDDAQKLGVTIIDESGLLALIPSKPPQKELFD
ncbi:MAG TPA: NAD-dependent DNA ligase LigA [Opitutales bacterium]|jgi:DNA ligase (NAD+)|nr:NAD-dependent DNA ligase LigA [Opitutales bacterium]